MAVDTDSKAVTEDSGDFLIGNDEELHNYVLNAQGITRAGLNVMCAIGLFIFGWLLVMAFNQLGKGARGWFYVVPVIFFLVISRGEAAALWFIAPIIYIAGWVDANLVLSRYESQAKQRITEIEQNIESKQTTNMLLEKGLLYAKVLRNNEQAFTDLDRVIHLPGGNPQLLNLAGVQFSAADRHEEAKQLFIRAMETATDDKLVKQISDNLASAKKKIK